MPKYEKHRIEKARESLLKRLSLKEIRKIPKYRKVTMAQYLKLIDKLEALGLYIIESYIKKKQQS